MKCDYCGETKHTADRCFKRVKDLVSVDTVLTQRGITLKNGRGQCPFQLEEGKGKDAFVVVNGRGWKCHSCGRKGNVISLVEALDGVDPNGAVRALLELLPGDTSSVPQTTATPPRLAQAQERPEESSPERNIPLVERGWKGNGELSGVNPEHPYLAERGFSPDLCHSFGVGFYEGKGPTMKNRVVFPIRNSAGQVVAYAGRWVGDETEEPRWKLPKDFHKSLELYNLSAVLEADCQSVIVCESFWGPLACARAGFPNAVALMGKELSVVQEKHLQSFERVSLLLDGDQPGRQATEEIAHRLLALHCFRSLNILQLPDGAQPDTVSVEVLQDILGPVI